MAHPTPPRLEPHTPSATDFLLVESGTCVPGDPRLLELELVDREGSSGSILLDERELDDLVSLLKNLVA